MLAVHDYEVGFQDHIFDNFSVVYMQSEPWFNETFERRATALYAILPTGISFKALG